jgi:hypothetical protein
LYDYAVGVVTFAGPPTIAATTKVELTGVTQNSQVDPAVWLKIHIRALELTQILGQPCEFQVAASASSQPHVAADDSWPIVAPGSGATNHHAHGAVLSDGPAPLKTDDANDPGAAEFERTRYKNAFLRRKKRLKERERQNCDARKGMTSCDGVCPQMTACSRCSVTRRATSPRRAGT